MSSQPVTLTLRYLRQTKGYSQSQLAELIGVNRVTVARWESGLTPPDIWDLRRIARALGVTVQIVADALPDGELIA